MNTKTIEFNKPNADPTTSESPWALPVKSTYEDLLLKPEFAALRYKFPIGTTWFRIVPALKASEKPWMLGVHALNYSGGRHAHPRTINPGAKGVFDHAYIWCKEHKKEALYSKSNKEGYKLLADPVCLFWMLVEENGKTIARLLIASGYDGSRGGVPGLGHQIWQLSEETDEDGNPTVNPADPDTGAQICIEKKQSPGARYPSYSLRLGRVPAPMADMLAKMDPEEVAALAPLEQVVHLPTEEEEWQLLEKVIDPETIREIRSSVD